MTTKASNTVSQISRLVGQNDNANHRVEIDANGDTVVYKGNVVIATIKDDVVYFRADEAYLDQYGTPKQIATLPLPTADLPPVAQQASIVGFRIDVTNTPTASVIVNQGECVGDDGNVIKFTSPSGYATITKTLTATFDDGNGQGGFCTGAGGIIPPTLTQKGAQNARVNGDEECNAFACVGVWVVLLTGNVVDVALSTTLDGSDIANKILSNTGLTVIDKRRIGWRLVYNAPLSSAAPQTPTGVPKFYRCKQLGDFVMFDAPIRIFYSRDSGNVASWTAATGKIIKSPLPPNTICSNMYLTFFGGPTYGDGTSYYYWMAANKDFDFTNQTGVTYPGGTDANGGLAQSVWYQYHRSSEGWADSNTYTTHVLPQILMSNEFPSKFKFKEFNAGGWWDGNSINIVFSGYVDYRGADNPKIN